MNCKEFRREFEELEMDERPSLAAEAHTETCAACRAFHVEQLSLRRLVGSLGTVSAPPDFDFRLRARILAAESNRQALNRARFAPGLKAIAFAASFVLLFAAALVFKQTQSGQISAPVVAKNPVVESTNGEASPKGVDLTAQQTNGQVAKAAEVVKTVATENEAQDKQASGLAQSRARAERLAQAKLARNTSPAKTNRLPVISNDITFGGNPPVVTPLQPSPDRDARDTEAAALLRVSSQPLKVLLHDREGATRSVSLERVVFGSQDFLQRAATQRPRASDAEGIW
jgi:hypothetical protein